MGNGRKGEKKRRGGREVEERRKVRGIGKRRRSRRWW